MYDVVRLHSSLLYHSPVMDIQVVSRVLLSHSCYRNILIHVSSYTWSGISCGYRLGNHGDMPQHFQSSSPSISTSHAALGPEHRHRAQAAGESQPCGRWLWVRLQRPSALAFLLLGLGGDCTNFPGEQGGLNESRSLIWVWWCRTMPSGSSRVFFWLPEGGALFLFIHDSHFLFY